MPNPLSGTSLSRQLSLYSTSADQAVAETRTNIGRLQEQLSSGLRINRPSDDATGFSQARKMEVLQDRYAQYQRSISSARLWVDHTQQALDEMVDMMVEVYEGGVRAANDSFSAEDRAVMASRIETVRDQIIERMNAKYGDEYIFGGTRSTEAPFSVTGPTVSYDGNTGTRERAIGPDQTLAINIDGARLQDTGAGFTVTDALQGLVDALNADDTDAINAALEEVTTARNHVIDMSGEAGNIGTRLTVAADQMRNLDYYATKRRADLEDADMAEAIMAFEREQTHLQAALRSAASIKQTTLLDYLR